MSFGFENDVLLASNVNFNPGTPPNLGTMVANGDLLIGNTAPPQIRVGQLTSTGGSVAITYVAPNINLESTNSGGSVTSISVVDINGFDGTVATPTTTPAITIKTTQTGLLHGDGTAIIGTPISQYNVLTAGASNAPNNVAPSATSGVPLISQGSSSQPVFGTVVVAGGGTGDTTLASNGILYGQGTSPIAVTPSVINGVLVTSNAGVPSLLANGTPGFLLTANSGAPPSWQPPASGIAGLVLISSQSLTGSAIAFTSLGSYTNYLLLINNLSTTSGTDQLVLQFSINGGSSYLNSGMLFGLNSNPHNSATLTNINSAQKCLLSLSQNLSLQNYCALINILDVGISNEGVAVTGEFTCLNTGPVAVNGKVWGQSSTGSGNNVNAFQLALGSQTFNGGTVTLYGYAV
jgi:hypothetical protein